MVVTDVARHPIGPPPGDVTHGGFPSFLVAHATLARAASGGSKRCGKIDGEWRRRSELSEGAAVAVDFLFEARESEALGRAASAAHLMTRERALPQLGEDTFWLPC
jgi:hypothetical protein